MSEQAKQREHDTPVVELKDISVEFTKSGNLFGLLGEKQTVKAVDGVSLRVGADQTVTLIGESGCGKSTLGRTLIGAQEPTSGTVEYRGQDIWEAKAGNGDISFSEIRKSLQIIHQDPESSLNPNQRIFTSLSLPLRKWNPDMSRQNREKRIHALLNRVGLDPADDYINRFPHQLSGGEQQRVALVRAMLMNPDLILADEAISALDVSLRVEMMDLMLELQDIFNTSYLFISHDLSNARYIAEKSDGLIAVMYLGRIVEVGTADQILEDPQHPYTKALRWATPNLYGDPDETEFPLRDIDVPDPTDVPSGCSFHPRCPEARETCREQSPPAFDGEGRRETRCFRADPDHEYWDSPDITGD